MARIDEIDEGRKKGEAEGRQQPEAAAAPSQTSGATNPSAKEAVQQTEEEESFISHVPISSDASEPFSVRAKLAEAVVLKAQGNEAFGQSRFDDALQKWHQGLSYLNGLDQLARSFGKPATPDELQEAASTANALWSNISACYVKQKQWEKVIQPATKVLTVDPKNRKVLYRRAQALMHLGALQESAQDLDAALDISPDDPALRSLAALLIALQEEHSSVESLHAAAARENASLEIVVDEEIDEEQAKKELEGGTETELDGSRTNAQAETQVESMAGGA